jgi:acyl carrier protein
MTEQQVRTSVLQALCTVAPEADPASLRPDVALREQLDIDSMDALRFLIELKRVIGVDIPERDYAQLVSLDAITSYLTARLTPRP